jgi:enterochelin esterase-like enzyme
MRVRRLLGRLGIRAAVAAALPAFVGGGCAGVAAAPHGAATRATAGGGRVVQGRVFSPAIRGSERYAVYLPAAYGHGTSRYPVIYALHGLPGGQTDYGSMPIAAWGRDAEQAGRPAIVVAPQGARSGDSDPEWHDWGRGRDWESAVATDVVDHIDRTYRTRADRRGRALIGVSAGGYGATLIALHHPAEFSVIQSWSGYFHPTNPDGTAPLDVGSADDDARASAHTYVPLARRMYRDLRPTSFGFYVGDADDRFLDENETLHRELLEARVPHRFAVYPGEHTGSFWAAHERTWIGYAVRELAR